MVQVSAVAGGRGVHGQYSSGEGGGGGLQNAAELGMAVGTGARGTPCHSTLPQHSTEVASVRQTPVPCNPSSSGNARRAVCQTNPKIKVGLEVFVQPADHRRKVDAVGREILLEDLAGCGPVGEISVAGGNKDCPAPGKRG